MIMRNVKLEVTEDTLFIAIDLKGQAELTKSGKTYSMASTGGNVEVTLPNGKTAKVGVNMFRQPETDSERQAAKQRQADVILNS